MKRGLASSGENRKEKIQERKKGEASSFQKGTKARKRRIEEGLSGEEKKTRKKVIREGRKEKEEEFGLIMLLPFIYFFFPCILA